MPRAYLRLDPDFATRKGAYPDGPYRALIDTFCAAEAEPKRGSFRSMAVLRAVIGKSARHLPYLFQHNDLIQLPDGRIYVVGWDEWQEGNWQVAERMRRVRERREGVTSETVTTVTPMTVTMVTPPAVTVPSEPLAVSGKPLAVAVSNAPASDERYDAPEMNCLSWLAKHKVALSETNGLRIKLIGLVEEFGSERVIGTFDRLVRAGVQDGDARNFVFKAEELLRPGPDLKALQREERGDDERRASQARYEATQRLLAEQARRRA